MELDDCAFPAARRHRDHLGPRDRLRRDLLGPPRRLHPSQGGHGARDLLSVNGGIFKPQGRAIAENAASRRAGPRRRQPLQHELPHRPLGRPRGARRPLVRHDPARREPGQDASSPAKAGAPPWPTSPTSPSGATTRPRSSPTSRTPASTGKPAAEVIDRRGVAAGRLHHDGAEARRRHHRRPRRSSAASAAARGDRLRGRASSSRRHRATAARSAVAAGRVRRSRGPAVRLSRALGREHVARRRGPRAQPLRDVAHSGVGRRAHRRARRSRHPRLARPSQPEGSLPRAPGGEEVTAAMRFRCLVPFRKRGSDGSPLVGGVGDPLDHEQQFPRSGCIRQGGRCDIRVEVTRNSATST